MKITDSTFVVLDCETTGLDPKVDHVIEIAAVTEFVNRWTNAQPILGMWQAFVRPPDGAIPPEISAITGITAKDVALAESFVAVRNSLSDFLYRFDQRVEGHALVGVAHHAEFDTAFLGLKAPNLPFLCTKRLAMHLWPDAPQHRNQTLRYWRGLEVDTFGIQAHRALADCLVTAALLRDELTCDEFRKLGIEDVDALIAYTETPILFETMPFGKHKGDRIETLPPSYISWCLREMPDLSRDMRFTLERSLKGAAA